MAEILRQSTAVDVLIGPFVDLTDAATAEEGETPAVLLSKNGQALGAKSDVTVPVHDDAGYYNCELDTTDTNTVGTLVLVVEKTATALPVRHEFQVLEEAVYDALFAAGAVGPLIPGNNAATTFATLTVTGLTSFSDGVEINNTDGVGLHIHSSAPAKTAVEIIGGGSGHGMTILGGSDGGSGLIVSAGEGGGSGLRAIGIGASSGIYASSDGTGHGIYALGGTATSGDGIYASGGALGHGMTLVGVGTDRYDFNADLAPNATQASLRSALGVTGNVYIVKYNAAEDLTPNGLTFDTPKLTAGPGVKTIIEAMSAGDACLIGPGTFTIANENKITQPAYTKAIGSGIDVTILNWAAGAYDGNVQYIPGSYSYQSDFTLTGTPVTPDYNMYGMGAMQSDGDAAFVGVVTERIKSTTWSDGFYLADTAAGSRTYQWTLIDCIVDNEWDASLFRNTNGTCDITFIRPVFDCLAPLANDDPSRGIVAWGAAVTVKAYDPHINVRTLSPSADDVAKAIAIFSGATVVLHGGTLRATGTMGSYDIFFDSTGTCIVAGTQYDRTKTYLGSGGAGVITEHATDKQVTPTAAAITAIQSGLATAANQTTIMTAVGTTIPGLIGLNATPAEVWAYASRVLTSSGEVKIVSPVTQDLDIEIVQYSDYSATAMPPLDWSNTAGDWLGGTILGATVTCTFKDLAGTTILTKAGTVVTATGTQAVRVTLTQANTALFTLPGQQYKYQLHLTTATEQCMIASGDVIVTPSVDLIA